jgi:iron complex transport system substrate-binding protein
MSISQLSFILYLTVLSLSRRAILEKADGDFLFVTTFTDSDKENLQQLLQKPLWKQLRAVQQNHVYFVDKNTWVGWNLLAAAAVIDDLFKYLVNTP